MTINETLEHLIKVNDRFLKEEPLKTQQRWNTACYFRGCLEAYKITGKKEYLDTVVEWCENNNWSARLSVEYARDVLINHFTVEGKLPWKYETAEEYRHIHADHVYCGQTYLDLMEFVPEKVNFDDVQRILDFTINDEHNDYWGWVDAKHMGLALYHRVAALKNDDRYAKKGHALYSYCIDPRGYYDKEEHLWYRDMKYTPDQMLSKNGKKVFWSRGNGWVYAGLIQTMDVIGEDSEYYEGYKKVFLDMTDALMKCRGKDGFWRTNLADAEEYPMPETSGTVLFLHSMIKAIHMGVLDESYIDVFLESFKAVTKEAVLEDGTLGWVQGVNQKPGEVFREDTKDYAVGYYLLTCCEWIAYCKDKGIE